MMPKVLALLGLLSPILLTRAQDGCQRVGCSGPSGSGTCEEVLGKRDPKSRRRLPGEGIHRCRHCPAGWTGLRCQRPCQDMMQQCTTRWEREGRCDNRRFTAFFDDNCPLTCGRCQGGDFELETPIPILAEQVAWIMGRWEADVSSGVRFPVSLSGPYHEIMDIRPDKVTMFDRPSLNVSMTAIPVGESWNVHRETGFLTSRFGNEDTGFLRQKDDPSRDARDIGLSLNSNTGFSTVEEGQMSDGGGRVDFRMEWVFALPGSEEFRPLSATRTLEVQGSDMTENTVIDYADGRRETVFKRFRRTRDYLEPQLKMSKSTASGTPRQSQRRGNCAQFTWEWDASLGDYVKSCPGDAAPPAATTQAPSASSGQGEWVWDDGRQEWVRSSSSLDPAPAAEERRFTWVWSDVARDWVKQYGFK